MKVHHLQNFHVLKLKVCEKCDAVFRMQREQDTQHARGYADCFGVQRAVESPWQHINIWPLAAFLKEDRAITIHLFRQFVRFSREKQTTMM